MPVVVGGAEIRPGDLVVMDCDGAMALPRERVDEVLPLALERAERERVDAAALRVRRALLRPATGLREVVEARTDGGRGARPRRGRRPDRRRSRRGRLRGARLGSRARRPAGSRMPRARDEAVRGADVVLSLNAAAVALDAAASVAGALGRDALYADLNTAAPEAQAELAAALPGAVRGRRADRRRSRAPASRRRRSHPGRARSASPSSSGRSACPSRSSARSRATPPG